MTEGQQISSKNIGEINRAISVKKSEFEQTQNPRKRASLSAQIEKLTRQWFQLAAPRGVRRQKNPAL